MSENLDFSGQENIWKTEKDHLVHIKCWNATRRVWEALLLDDGGAALCKIQFDENGRNKQYGDLMIRKRGAQKEFWPSFIDKRDMA